jgi:DNA-binding transcriptional regulator/RsmH inhibitor MraZ
LKGEEKDSNHAVMIVGFNKDFGFWSKNSWAGTWEKKGISGLIRNQFLRSKKRIKFYQSSILED